MCSIVVAFQECFLFRKHFFGWYLICNIKQQQQQSIIVLKEQKSKKEKQQFDRNNM